MIGAVLVLRMLRRHREQDDWSITPEKPFECLLAQCPGNAPHLAHVWPPAGPTSRAWCPGRKS